MTPVVLLVLAIVWIVVLAPGLIKRWRERHSVESIDSFHYQLHLLERTGPKLVEPAYSLNKSATTSRRRSNSAGGYQYDAASRARTGSNGSLVLLRPLDDRDAVELDDDKVVDDDRGGRYERVGLCAVPDSKTSSIGRRDPEAYRRRQVRKRRRDLLAGIVVTLVLTGALGFIQSFRVLWVFTVLSAVALAGYVALAAYAQSIEEASHARGRRREASRASATERRRMASYRDDEDEIYEEGFGDRYYYGDVELDSYDVTERRAASR